MHAHTHTKAYVIYAYIYTHIHTHTKAYMIDAYIYTHIHTRTKTYICKPKIKIQAPQPSERTHRLSKGHSKVSLKN